MGEISNAQGLKKEEYMSKKSEFIRTKKFICPWYKGITTNPYECNSGIKKDNKACDWKVYGLFDLGHVTVFVKDKLRFDKIFTPVDWEEGAKIK